MDLKRRLRPRANRVGAYLLIVVFITIFIPTPYTIQSPGPTFDTLEQVEVAGSSYHMVEIDGAKTYPTDGSLNLTTISVSGPDVGIIDATSVISRNTAVPIYYPGRITVPTRNHR